MLLNFVTLLHCLRTGYILAREGALGLVDPQLLPPSAATFIRVGRLIERKDAGDRGTRLRSTLSRLGPTYIKLGQFLATRPDIVGFEIAHDLEYLQDRVDAFPQEEAIRIIEESFGQNWEDIFENLSEPVAAASIAQVHKAQLKNGQKPEWVAVKIIRPGIRKRFDRDLANMRFMADLVEKFGGREAKRFRAPEVVATISRAIVFEMDMRLEAAGLSELADNTKNDADFRVPVPVWDYTTGSVLTSEWIDGIRLNDMEGLKQAGVDCPRLARIILESFLRHAIRDGFFHADMHPGNLFIDQEQRLVAVDFGIMGRLSLKDRLYLGEILYGFITRDYKKVAEVHFAAGYVPQDQSVENFTQAIRAVGEPIHNRNADEFSMAKVLSLLFDITSLFRMQTRTELVMLQKNMVVIEGLTRILDPKINIWEISKPIVTEWLGKEFGPSGHLERAGAGMRSLGHLMLQVPDLSQRSLALFEKLELFSKTGRVPESEASVRREKRRLFWQKQQTFALWIISLSLLFILFK